MKNKRAYILLFLAAATLCGCSPSKRLSRLLKAHPELATYSVTTTVKHDTLITREYHKDSIIRNIFSKDTVFIKSGKESVKYVYMQGTRGYISARVAPDTVIKIDTLKSTTRTLVKEVKAPKTGFEIFCEWLVIFALIFLFGKYIGLPVLRAFVPKLPF